MTPDWSRARAPSLDEFALLAEAALANLPGEFRALVGDVEMRIQEFAEEEVLQDLGPVNSRAKATGSWASRSASRSRAARPFGAVRAASAPGAIG